MYEANARRILETVQPDDVVVDIGGWARRFRRANYVIDGQPIETRGLYLEPQGGERECFTKATWVQRDICDREPLPFADKSIDFVICSHTLEDLRDPLWVCAEMIRIAKRGYVEVPSREAESCRRVRVRHVGWDHHRWLIEIVGTQITFLMKSHLIHDRWRFSLPASHLRKLPEQRHVQWLFWEDEFQYTERLVIGIEDRPYPAWLLAGDRAWQSVKNLQHRISGKIRRHLSSRY
jgi:hypothetical protein